MILPKDFEELVNLLDKEFNFTDILIVNTFSTGIFLDKILLNKNTIRIKYTKDNYNDFIEKINNINKTFDLICLDPYHEYNESISNFNILCPLLNDNGIVICHDCKPPKFEITSPNYIKGEWCGVTYATFIEIAYNNPDLYYSIIDRDYGLGIISKKEIKFVKKITNHEKQKIFLDFFIQKKYREAYDYFIQNSSEMINLIN